MRKILVMLFSAMLFCASAFATDYSNPEVIKQVQQALNEAGFDCGSPDGVAGSMTGSAIARYREANNLSAGTQIDEELYNKLFPVEATAAADPADPVATPTEAPAPTPEPGKTSITFRSIPWGISYGVLMSDYNEFGIKDSDPYISKYLTVPSEENDKINVYGNGYSVASDDGAGFDKSVGNYRDVVCYVAGYEVMKVEYSFIFSIDGSDGHVNLNAKDARLFGGEYIFHDMNDATSMREDLIVKLSSVYGEASDTDTSSYTSGDVKYKYLWEDESGNWIILFHNASPDEPDNIYLRYYCGDIFDWMQELTDAYKKAESESFVVPDGTDGL